MGNLVLNVGAQRLVISAGSAASIPSVSDDDPTAGWTTFTESADTRKVYVSKSGSDSNDGLTTSTPKLTLAAGYALLRTGYPDWLLLNKGDEWSGESFVGSAAWGKSGRSSNEPILLGAYGTGARPIVHPTANVDGWATASPGSSVDLNYVTIVGIKFLNTAWDGATGTAPVGINWLRAGYDFWIEDVHVEGFSSNMLIQGYGSAHTMPGLHGFTMRRSLSVNPLFNTVGGTTGNTCIYVDRTDSMLIEENYFGQTLANESSLLNRLSHCQYLYQDNGAGSGNTIRRNVYYNGRSNCTVRMDATVTDNLSIRGGLCITLGQNAADATPWTGSATYNVVNESRDHWDGTALGWALDLRNILAATVTNNLVCNSTAGRYNVGIILDSGSGVITYTANISSNKFYNWAHTDAGGANEACVVFYAPPGPVTFENNTFDQPTNALILTVASGGSLAGVTFTGNTYNAAVASPFVRTGVASYTDAAWIAAYDVTGVSAVPSYADSTRTAGTYNSVVRSGTGTSDALFIAMCAQSRDTWDATLTASAVNNWLRAGFSMSNPA